MTPVTDNQQEIRYADTLTRFCHWLAKNQTNSNSAAQSFDKKIKLPSFSECLDFRNRQESI